jgi:TRAP-type C4-dicarboxylate transport system permease small subunit
MNVVGRIAKWLQQILDYLTLICYFVMVVSIVIQVFARYVLNSPTPWSEELARFLMVAVTMLGSATLMRKEGHIAMTALVDRLSGKALLVVTLIRDVLIIGMAGLLTYYGIGLAQIAKRQMSTGMEIPVSIPYAAIPIGSFFIGIMLLLSRIAPTTDTNDEGLS